MALTVEDGTGLAAAEAYVSVADADAYWVLRFPPVEWKEAATSERERALRTATEWLDAQFVHRWRGVIKVSTQALSWPRSGAYDIDGRGVSSSAVPTAVERATAELAAELLVDPAALRPGPTDAEDVEEETIRMEGTTHVRKFRATGGPSAIVSKVENSLLTVTRGRNESVRG